MAAALGISATGCAWLLGDDRSDTSSWRGAPASNTDSTGGAGRASLGDSLSALRHLDEFKQQRQRHRLGGHDRQHDRHHSKQQHGRQWRDGLDADGQLGPHVGDHRLRDDRLRDDRLGTDRLGHQRRAGHRFDKWRHGLDGTDQSRRNDGQHGEHQPLDRVHHAAATLSRGDPCVSRALRVKPSAAGAVRLPRTRHMLASLLTAQLATGDA